MNMLDYIAWRGDLALCQSEFNEADNLIMSYLAYVNLDGIAPGAGEAPVSVKEISKRFFDKYTEKDLEKDKSFIRLAPEVLKAMGKSKRFGELLVQNYVNKIDLEKTLQFAAMEIVLDDGTSYIAYRGTDDTIVGWKEDFYLSKGEVPAEKEAVAYLNDVGAKLPESDRKLRIGGHSKGGNLAIYAAACCERSIQDRITVIYNNDGPGFTKEFFEKQGLLRIKEKIRRYIPESSVIGMLLDHVVEPKIIQSSQKGIMQHDGFSWEILGPSFLYCEKLSSFAEGMDISIKNWLADLKDEQRDMVIDDLFAVLETTKAQTLTELQDGGIKNIATIIKAIDEMNSDSKEVLQKLVKEWMSNLPQMFGITDLLHLPKKKADAAQMDVGKSRIEKTFKIV